MARVYNIGQKESQAVSNMMTNISKNALEFITNSVRSRGMLKYISHDILAKNILNRNFTSGISGLEAWRDEFRNKDDDVLVAWTLNQMFFCTWIIVSKFTHFIRAH